MTDAILEKLK